MPKKNRKTYRKGGGKSRSNKRRTKITKGGGWTTIHFWNAHTFNASNTYQFVCHPTSCCWSHVDNKKPCDKQPADDIVPGQQFNSLQDLKNKYNELIKLQSRCSADLTNGMTNSYEHKKYKQVDVQFI